MYSLLSSLQVASWYKSGESYDSLFSSLGSSYEECRAECVGIYLSAFNDILKVFHHDGQEAENVLYINWLSMILGGINGMEAFNVDSGKWGQAHSQARFVILRVLMEQAKDLITIDMVTNKDDGKPDMLITVDREEIMTSGKKAIEDFLMKLQVYKSTADITSARKMFDNYSELSAKNPTSTDYLKMREIVLDRKKPRTVLVQYNTVLDDGEVVLKTYDSTPEGFAQSWVERYNQPEIKYKSLRQLYEKDAKFFPL